jgi:hypothetical protein
LRVYEPRPRGRSAGARRAALAAAAVLAPAIAGAAGLPTAKLEEVVVTARRLGLVGTVDSASEGTVFSDQLENRPVLRPGEVLEVVPGLVVTQHSGDGKANQYFLRGFNLDHGTDFATRVDGVQVNMPTHAHGQGYSDLNFLIPELVDRIEYRKGTYYADEGNFSAAGSADIRYKRTMPGPTLELQGSAHGFGRAVVAASPAVAGGDLLLGAEYFHNDGPWDLKEGFRKVAGIAKLSRGSQDSGVELAAMGYDGRWRSTDQIPARAVAAGEIDRYGAIDPTDGGTTHRYSLSAAGWSKLGRGHLRGSAYAIDYRLDLVSDFTYAIDRLHGDQFEQSDRRHVYGGELAWQQSSPLAGRQGSFQAGLQTRVDDIAPVALYRTLERVRYATVRRDDVRQWSVSAYAAQSVQVTSWLRGGLGVRFDRFHFDVASSLAANSGTASDSIASPKLTLVFGPWARTELFANAGRGFHSNDARGTTIRVDPNDGATPVERVSPLVRATGAEVGLRTAAIPNLQLAASLWTLKLDSELVFSGDGGTTEPSRASRRAGVELGAYFAPLEHVVFDADLAWTRARYTEPGPAGDRIPNAVESVFSVGVTVNREVGWYGGARLRYFGPAPLTEDDSARSASTLMVNLDAGYHFTPRLSAAIAVFNLLNHRDNDITYFYESQLRGEPAPVADYHFHPVEPRTVRATVWLRVR